jgi:hypothetical protein
MKKNRCSGSVTFWYESGSVSQTNESGILLFFCPRPSRHHSSKIKLIKSQKTEEIKVFLLLLLDDGRIRIRTSD